MNDARNFARFSFPAAAFLLPSFISFSAHSQASTSTPPPDVSSSQWEQDTGSTLTTTASTTDIRPERLTGFSTGELWKHPGIGISVGVNGVGLDIAEPLGQRFNVRVGGEYLGYKGDFATDGAQINVALSVGGGHVALDYYPWHNGFRISPQVRFAVQTEANLKVLVASGREIDLDGGGYVSSDADPLHGTGFVSTRKTAPGISIGYGNLSPRHGSHFSFPVEFGFYYIGQPSLHVTFDGSACDPSFPQTIGCADVTADPTFQSDLKKFITRQNNNLSYGTFFPIVSAGFGYRF